MKRFKTTIVIKTHKGEEEPVLAELIGPMAIHRPYHPFMKDTSAWTVTHWLSGLALAKLKTHAAARALVDELLTEREGLPTSVWRFAILDRATNAAVLPYKPMIRAAETASPA